MKFKEWLELNPPAIVRSINQDSGITANLSKLQKWITNSKEYLLKAINIYKLEASSLLRNEVENIILPNPKFQQYIKSKFGDINPINARFGGYLNSCGQDSCAYFYTNKYIIKFLGGRKSHQEYEIALAIKGELKLVPVIDAFEIEVTSSESVTYVIVMRELRTDVYSVGMAIIEAANIVSGTVHSLQELVERKPDIPVDYIRKRLSVSYMLRDTNKIDPNVKAAVVDLIKVLRLVYDKSGYLFGADWSQGRNIGVRFRGLAPDRRKPMPFDFGRPDIHQAKSQELSQIKGDILTI